MSSLIFSAKYIIIKKKIKTYFRMLSAATMICALRVMQHLSKRTSVQQMPDETVQFSKGPDKIV